MNDAGKSALFHVDPASWLGRWLDSGRLDVCSVRAALEFECRLNKGETPRPELQEALEREYAVMGRLPDAKCALRGDKVEKTRASETREDLLPSVDVYVGRNDDLLLAECKYKASPETQIVKSVDTFRLTVVRKFEAASSFLKNQGATRLSSDRVVLFNAESKDKVVSMFRRLQLQDESDLLLPYRLMDTAEFAARYFSCL